MMNKMQIHKIKKINSKNREIIFNNGESISLDRYENLQVDDVVLYNKDSDKIRESILYEEANEFIKSKEFKIDNSNIVLKINKFINRVGSFKFNEINDKNEVYKIALKNITDLKNILKSKENGFKIIKVKASILDKLIIGMGEPSIFENDITLHHTYGIPYIPGQALKGNLRNHIIIKYFTSDENAAMGNKVFSVIFGNQENGGKSIFLDSFPLKNFIICPDVMTPHHPEYYAENSKALPLDSDDPNPIKFLVVKNAEFEFNIAIDKNIIDLNEVDEEEIFYNKNKSKDKKLSLEDFIIQELKEVLEYEGLGAKTSVGYGYFKVEEDKKLHKEVNNHVQR